VEGNAVSLVAPQEEEERGGGPQEGRLGDRQRPAGERADVVASSAEEGDASAPGADTWIVVVIIIIIIITIVVVVIVSIIIMAAAALQRGTVEIRYSDTNNVYKTKSFRCQNSGTRLYCPRCESSTERDRGSVGVGA
jgi:hypothetical protein